MPSLASARSETDGVPAVLATPLEDGSVRCGVCAHRCLLRPGRVGICGVRENRDGRLVSLAYGSVVALGLDPIEKKPLFHVAPGSTAFSNGWPTPCRAPSRRARASSRGGTAPARHGRRWSS